MSSDQLTFAMGCFWGPEERFAQIPGVTATRVGYSGGESVVSSQSSEAEAPTHRRLNGHSEVVDVRFDPEVITLEKLLEIFWKHHNPAAIEGYKPDDSRYRSLLFYRNEDQRKVMEKVQQQMSRQGIASQATELKKIQPFYIAEDKHQRYEQKKRRKQQQPKNL
ncbi:peptide-methionine (S)-S-oxide reductase MsrA [Saccharibacillus sp. JS10]|uniref:peptide-methionine (S)-S-oxide reductase MsrA n=1 Tax=Saccharibacillus sp. JS10 TaxID=2950552 RepID=UPI002108EFA2|nr:peptide-methionine (S)-S-oxide reductase MsrA [Saccharibacillus sp. JS10]MCQ4087666.1 peptide-methionine (S)-S-oxide reductase MsrA [Saccharibacillus sp. JS10]